MNKPEWFELTEKDGGKTHFEVKRGLRSFALAIPLLAIGVGVVFAQGSNESPATAEETTVAAASAAPSVTPSITSKVAPAKPSIATPPLAPTGADDDDEYENDDEEDDD